MNLEEIKMAIKKLNKSYEENGMEFEGFDIEIIEPDKNNNRKKHFGLLENTTAEIVLTAPFMNSQELLSLLREKVDAFLEPISYQYLGVYIK